MDIVETTFSCGFLIKENNDMNNYPVTRFIGTVKDPKWELTEDFTRGGIVVPKGFIYDKASVPRFLWWMLPPFGLYERAAVIHDWLYTNRGFIDVNRETRKAVIWTRSTTDSLFRTQMIRDGVKKRRANMMYLAVRAFGQSRWDN